MNLYRNFGDLLETLLDRAQNGDREERSDSEVGATSAVEMTMMGHKWRRASGGFPTPLLKMGSKDSGVEIPSGEADNALASPRGSEWSFFSGRDAEDEAEESGSPSSPPPSCSSSASSQCEPIEEQGEALLSTLDKVEQALQRTGRTRGETRKKPHLGSSPSPSLRHMLSRPRGLKATLPPRPGQWSERHRLRGSPIPSPQTPQAPQRLRCYPDLQEIDICQKQNEAGPPLRSKEGEAKDELSKNELSPQLGYLEQVCKLLEEICRLRRSNLKLQQEVESLQSRSKEEETRHFLFNQCTCSAAKAANQEPDTNEASYLLCESSQTQTLEFRRRSLSDSQALIRPLGKQQTPSERRGSTGDLLKQMESGTQSKTPKGVASRLGFSLKTGLQTSSQKRKETEEQSSQQAFHFGESRAKPRFGLFKGRTRNTPAC